MDFLLSFNNNEKVLTFPVIPNGGINPSRGQANQTFDSLNGEMQAIGTMNLTTFEFSSFFPCRAYSWARPDSLADGWEYVRTIEEVRERRIPFRAIYLDNDGTEIFNLPVTVEGFEYGLDQARDIAYSISFREYRFAKSAAVDKLPTAKDAAGVKTEEVVETTAQQEANTGTSAGGTFQKLYTQQEAVMMGKTMFNESRGIKSKTEIACIGWTICNRVDAGYARTPAAVMTAPHQFAYTAGAKTVSDHGYDLVALATDVLDRWSREHAGQTNVGRVLPKDYLWYAGDGRHNYFRNKYKGGTRWNYSLPSPYDS